MDKVDRIGSVVLVALETQTAEPAGKLL